MSASAVIIPFPVDRTRPGIRDLVAHCGRAVEEAVHSGEWAKTDADDLLGRIRTIVPTEAEMLRMAEDEIVEIAEALSLVCLYAIHVGVWRNGDIQLMMWLQSVSSRHSRLQSLG